MNDRNYEQEVLSTFVGERMTAVKFILDYLVLEFDRAGSISLSVWPTVNKELGIVIFGDTDYRNELCRIIGFTVIDATINDKSVINISFENDSIEIDLSKSTVEERAVFDDHKGSLLIF